MSWPRARLQPATDKSADVVDLRGGKRVALGHQALQILRQPHLEAEDLEREVGLFEQGLSRRVVASADERLQKAVERPLDPLAGDEAMVAGKPAGVSAAPENQVVGLGDHDQFLIPGLASRHRRNILGIETGSIGQTKKSAPAAPGRGLCSPARPAVPYPLHSLPDRVRG